MSTLRPKRLIASLSMSLLILASATNPAHAARPTPEPTSPPIASGNHSDVGIQNTGCYVRPKSGVGSVNIRNGPSTAYGVWGSIPQGGQSESVCYKVAGGSYTACGGESYWWIEVWPDSWTTGKYVALNCVDFYNTN